MAHHKRRRAPAQRAGCLCGGKAAKKLGRGALRGTGSGYWDYNERGACCNRSTFGCSSGRELRLRERAREAA